jgi:hypothetical protein
VLAATRSVGLMLFPQRHSPPQFVEEVLEDHDLMFLLGASADSTVTTATRLLSAARSYAALLPAAVPSGLDVRSQQRPARLGLRR